MSERLFIVSGKVGAIFIEMPDDNGHGATGQVKKASFWGREVTVQGQKMNAGSLIDFLNTQVADDKKLKKGFFGLGGSSKKEIQAVFDEIYPIDTKYKAKFDEAKKSFVLMNPFNDPFIKENFKTKHPDKYSAIMSSENTTILITRDNSEIFEGIFITTEKNKQHPDVKANDPVLHICLDYNKLFVLPDDVDLFSPSYEEELNELARANAKDILAPLFEKAIEKLVELGHDIPVHFCCDYDDNDSHMRIVKEWQKLNGREQLLLENQNI